MGIDTDIRQIAREAAREVLREELKQIEVAFESKHSARTSPEPLLTVEAVATLCGVAPKTVQRWIARGLLRAMRSPGMREYRITLRDYDAFTNGPAASPVAERTAESRDLEHEASRVLAAALSPKRARR